MVIAKCELAQLRHLYAHMVNGRVKDTKNAAEGLLAPAIECFEGLLDEHEKCKKALEALVLAKAIKEEFGKTPEYLELRDEGWRLAHAVVPIQGCICHGLENCRWCVEMASRHPRDCDVCASFAENGGGTPEESAGDCYLHQYWKG